MIGPQQRWLEFLAAERRRRVEYRATHGSAAERLEAELEAMYQRIIASGIPWSPAAASMAERVALFGRWPSGSEVDPEREEAAIDDWLKEHGYS